MAPSFGLDISDQSLKFVELNVAKDGIRMGRFGERKIPAGIIESGKIKNPKRLKEEVLLPLRREEGIRFVRVSLPEEQVYLFHLRLEKEGLQNLREGIELALEEHVPIPAAEAIFDYELLNQDARSIEVEVAAIPQGVIQNYLSVFRESFISVQSFELEAQAISRAVIKKGDLDTYMIVDFGQTRTGIFIITRGLAVFTTTFDMGGASLASMIQKSFGISLEEAEKMKVEAEETGEECEKCGKPMVIRYGRFGKFMACSGFPECKNTKTLAAPTGLTCQLCGGSIVMKRTRHGRMFWGCSNYPKCKFASWKKPDVESKKKESTSE